MLRQREAASRRAAGEDVYDSLSSSTSQRGKKDSLVRLGVAAKKQLMRFFRIKTQVNLRKVFQ